METEIARKLLALLKEEGFEITEESINTQWMTLGAQKGEVRLVVHATDRDFQPAASVARTSRLQPNAVFMRAGLPNNVLSPEQVSEGRAGAGGATGVHTRAPGESIVPVERTEG